VIQPSVHEGGDRDLSGLDVGAGVHLGGETGALLLRLALAAGEAVPLSHPLARLWIGHIEDDGPSAGRTLADMALHGLPTHWTETAGFTLRSARDRACVKVRRWLAPARPLLAAALVPVVPGTPVLLAQTVSWVVVDPMQA
jgi:hypothetical protein